MTLLQDLIAIAGEQQVLCDEPMSKHITFRAGGKADYFVKADSKEKLLALVSYLKKHQIDYFIMGNGSNLLFSDEGYRGVVIKIERFADDLQIEGESLIAGAGVLLSQAAMAACKAGLSGMECLAGIPGTVGGAVVMNAGAYGGEIKDVIEWAKAIDAEGNFVTLSKEELNLSYRHSIAHEKPYIFVEAKFMLKKGKEEEIRAVIDELAAKRREKQPLEYASAGSTFKRPEGYFAGKLIEDAGLRGFTIGGAGVSQKHCGFVVNTDHATATDILAVIETVQNTVWQKFQVKLEPEVRIIGKD